MEVVVTIVDADSGEVQWWNDNERHNQAFKSSSLVPRLHDRTVENKDVAVDDDTEGEETVAEVQQERQEDFDAKVDIFYRVSNDLVQNDYDNTNNAEDAVKYDQFIQERFVSLMDDEVDERNVGGEDEAGGGYPGPGHEEAGGGVRVAEVVVEEMLDGEDDDVGDGVPASHRGHRHWQVHAALTSSGGPLPLSHGRHDTLHK